MPERDSSFLSHAEENARKEKMSPKKLGDNRGTIRYLSQSHDLLRDSPEVCRLLVRKAAIDRGQ